MGRCNFILAFIWCSSLSAQIATAQSCPTVPAPGTCGCDFDLIFENGYQPPAAASALPPNSTPLALNWTTPADGAIVGAEFVQPRGSFTGPANTGITVNERVALTAADGFLGPTIALTPGSNVLTLKATTLDGATQTITRTITFNASIAPEATLVADAVGGYVPYSASFRVRLKSGSDKTIQQIAIDYLSDGQVDFTTSDPLEVLSNSYSNIGLAQASAVVTLRDPMNVTSTVNVSRWVLSESLPITRLTLCKVFNDMKLRLAANSIPQALLAVNADYRPRMQALWTGLGAGLPNAANNLGFVLDGDLSSYQAQLRVARPQATLTNWSVFPMLLTRDADGVWRIRRM